jgi:HAE1 family hydrophobic/amphiphilic exporter-1
VKRLIAFFVDNFVLTLSVFGAVILFGAIGALSLGVDLMPEIDIPVVAVATVYPGAGPEEVSRQISEPLEGALATLPGITSLTSTSNEGLSFVIAQFSSATDLNQAAVDVSQRVNQLAARLPDGAQTPSVQKFDPGDEPIMSVALSAAGTDLALLQAWAEDELRPVLRRVSGVADVEVIGPAERQLQVLLRPDRLEAFGISPGQVVGAIGASALDVPAGTLSFADNRILLVGRGTPGTAAGVEQIQVDPVSGLRVSDVATVRDASSAVTSFARLDGESIILLDIRKTPGSNAVGTANNVRAALSGVVLPAAYSAVVVNDMTEFVASSVNDTLLEIAMATLAVSLIVLMFVGRLGTVFAVVLAIPVSIAGALVAFSLLGFTFNIVTLLAITVAIGLVIDDAIVVAENIDRYRKLGYPLREAVLEGAGEVSTAVLAATMSLLAVFIPISFLPGVIGQFFAQFGITLAVAIAFSYLEAMFFLTMRLALSPDPLPPNWAEVPGAARSLAGDFRWSLRALARPWFWLLLVAAAAGIWFLAAPAYLWWLVAVPAAMLAVRYLGRLALFLLGALALNLHQLGDWLMEHGRKAYVKSLAYTLGHAWLILGVTLALFASIFWVFPQLGFNFQPPIDAGFVQVSMELPPGTTLDRTNELAQLLEQHLYTDPAVTSVQTTVGSGGSLLGGGAPERASLSINLVPRAQRQHHTDELTPLLEAELREVLAAWPEVKLTASVEDAGLSVADAGLSITLGSSDLLLLRERSEQARVLLEGNPRLRNASSNAPQILTERVFLIDEGSLDGTGLLKADVFQALRAYNVGSEAASTRLAGGTEIPIHVRVDPAELSDEQSLASLPVYAPALRRSLPLGSFGHFETREAPASISRANQQYSVTLSAALAPGVNQLTEQNAVLAQFEQEGITDARVTQMDAGGIDLLGDLLFYGPIAFGLALLLNYLAIGSQFNSFRYPIYLLLTVPLALIGTVWVFWLRGMSLDVISILGVVMLIGLVTKNAILLLDVTLAQVRRGVPLRDALIEAGSVRFRPIIMTTVTVLVISLPLILGLGEGSELRQPLGVVILSGVLTSALLTFYVVPAAFFTFERRTYAANEKDATAASGEAQPTLAS